MVEMRWLEKIVRSPQSAQYDTLIKVLQYRQTLDVIGFGQKYTTDERGINWSEWIDVPTVTEP